MDIPENNLPIPNAGEWELKCQRMDTLSLTTLFHMEPSPRAFKFVPQILLLKYGWPHKTIKDELSFRQTIIGGQYTDRGFTVLINRNDRKVLLSFDSQNISACHSSWKKSVNDRIGLAELNPQPYWGFDDLHNKAGTKLLNCFYVRAEIEKRADGEYYHYTKIMMLSRFDFSLFLNQMENGNILVDFDARTHHNHGTKFRMRQGVLDQLYAIAKEY